MASYKLALLQAVSEGSLGLSAALEAGPAMGKLRLREADYSSCQLRSGGPASTAGPESVTGRGA